MANFVKYALVGLLGLVVDMGIFYLLNKYYGINYAIANVVSSSFAVIHNFVLNSIFTFRVTDRMWKRFILFYAVAAIGMLLSTALLALMIDVLKLDSIPSKMIALFFVAILQFAINKKITFRTHTNS